MENFNAYTYTMAKTANIASAVGNFLARPDVSNGVKTVSTGLATAAGITALSANLLSTIYNKIRNDTRRKAIIEDLAKSDPVLKEVDTNELQEWFGTMYYYAPTLTADKSTVREVLTGFARFGRIDLQTLKMLAETEEKLAKLKSSGFANFMPKLSL